MNLLVLLDATGAGGSSYMSIVMLVLIVVVFYIFMIRPQMKRQKELRKFQESLSKGDKVIVAGGIFGKVSEVKDDSVVVEIAHDMTVRVLKNSVFRDAADVAPQK